ncbi:MAG: molybdopterin-dependent oxidoreductase [Acidobacteriaceae bacterium]
MDRAKAVCHFALLLIFCSVLMLSETSLAQFGTDRVHNPPANVLFIYGSAAHAIAIDVGVIETLPQLHVRGTNSANNKSETYAGVPLKDLLARAGVGTAESLTFVAVGKDGNRVPLSSAETEAIFHDENRIIVADAMNGKRLDASSGPLVLIFSDKNGSLQAVRNLARIQVNTAK